jgi:hypothetical protein
MPRKRTDGDWHGKEVKRGLYRLCGLDRAGKSALKRTRKRVWENEQSFYAAEGQGFVPTEAARQLNECLMLLIGKPEA